MVLSVAPSNENVVYFLTSVWSGNYVNNFPGLYKYTYISGDGSGDGGTWENRSNQIPYDDDGYSGIFSIQNGYNMSIAVKPDDENFLVIGGVNLYTSHNGFETSARRYRIGGYQLTGYWDLGNSGHDHHIAVFHSSDPDKLWTGNDSGIQRTNNIRNSQPTWSSLNNGYNTSMLYYIGINQIDTTDDAIIGGFQDIGNRMSWYDDNTEEENQEWFLFWSGDGAANGLDSDRRFRFFSTQNGNARIKTYFSNFTTNRNNIDISPVPGGGGNYMFISPGRLDRVNTNILYYAQNANLWRNSDVYNATTTQGWAELTNAGANGNITSIQSSITPANVVYYGTSNGGVYRLDNANTGNPSSTNIYSGKGMGNGTVKDIDVNPLDVNEVLICFSNYEVRSVFHTTDGGQNWTHVSGSLEEFENGSGNGPSTQSVAILPLGNVTRYFVGTSTGLYSTTTIDGSNTVWTKESADLVGSSLVVDIQTRYQDGTVALGTHGSGTFRKKFRKVLGAHQPLNIQYGFSQGISFRNKAYLLIKANKELSSQSGDYRIPSMPSAVNITNFSNIDATNHLYLNTEIRVESSDNLTINYSAQGIDDSSPLDTVFNIISITNQGEAFEFALENVKVTGAQGSFSDESFLSGKTLGVQGVPSLQTEEETNHFITIGHSELVAKKPISIRFNVESRTALRGKIYRLDSSNNWEEVTTNRYGKTLAAKSKKLGLFRVFTSNFRKNENTFEKMSFELNANYPNPFNPSTTIPFSLKESGQMSIVIYNSLGQKVKTLFSGTMPSGENTLTWDGTNASGQKVASGIYFYKLISAQKTLTRRMVLSK